MVMVAAGEEPLRPHGKNCVKMHPSKLSLLFRGQHVERPQRTRTKRAASLPFDWLRVSRPFARMEFLGHNVKGGAPHDRFVQGKSCKILSQAHPSINILPA